MCDSGFVDDAAALSEPAGADEAVASLLRKVVAGLAGSGEDRPGQLEMACAVARTVEEDGALIVQAGTGTGKSLAYLVPLALARRTAVVATATKALQDQLATKDLPEVRRHVRGLKSAVLKGRANYVLCPAGARDGAQAVSSSGSTIGTPGRGGGAAGRPSSCAGSSSGRPRPARATAASSTSSRRPRSGRASASAPTSARAPPAARRVGAASPRRRRRRAAEADIVVVNLHLYGAHLASGGEVLPEHDVVVIDEAHALEDVLSSALGVELGGGRLRRAAAVAAPRSPP